MLFDLHRHHLDSNFDLMAALEEISLDQIFKIYNNQNI